MASSEAQVSHAPTADPGLPAQGPARRRARRALRAGLAILGAAAIAYGAAQVAVRHACGDGALRARIAGALEGHLGPVELGPDVHVDPLFRVRFGPLTLPGLRRGDAPLVRIESLRVRPDLAQLLRTGHAVPASVRIERVRVELPDRPGLGSELVRRFAPRRAPGRSSGDPREARPLPALRVGDLEVAFTFRGHRAVAGPLQLTVPPRLDGPDSPTVSATIDLPAAGRAEVELRREGQAWRASARVDGLDPRALPAGLEALADAWAGGSVSARTEALVDPARRHAEASLEVAARGLRVGGPVVGPEPIGPVDLAFAGQLDWEGRARKVRLTDGRLTLPGGAPVRIDAVLGLERTFPIVLEARAESVDYLATMAALPPALALPADAPHPAGAFDAHLELAGPLADPAAWQIDAGLDLSRMRKEARRSAPEALHRPFTQHVEVEGGRPHGFLVGPANPDFVPVGELPAYVVRAVTTSEDASFFSHSGFDFEELRNAAVEGAQAGKVVRGGSTISQQLAKNLYLTREKTLARKLREALVTVALEATVTKQRLLEIYLNVAEWGPNVWGIGPAARHWFGKDARELTPKEAAFLATVIPNPVRYHYMWDRGWLSEHWEERVEGLLRAMNSQGSLSEEQLTRALEQPLTFARCAAGAEGPASGVTCRGT